MLGGRAAALFGSGLGALVGVLMLSPAAPLVRAQPVVHGVMAQGAQVSRGEQAYMQSCVQCHGVNLEGTVGPTLTDSRRLSAYGTAARLYIYTRGTMPLDGPGSLPEQTYYDVLAYVLQRNNLLPAEQTVDASTAEGLSLRN